MSWVHIFVIISEIYSTDCGWKDFIVSQWVDVVYFCHRELNGYDFSLRNM